MPPLKPDDLRYILDLCDRAARQPIDSESLVVKVKVARYNRETYRLWPGGPVGIILDEVPPYIVVAFKADEVRSWAERKLIKEQS